MKASTKVTWFRARQKVYFGLICYEPGNEFGFVLELASSEFQRELYQSLFNHQIEEIEDPRFVVDWGVAP